MQFQKVEKDFGHNHKVCLYISKNPTIDNELFYYATSFGHTSLDVDNGIIRNNNEYPCFSLVYVANGKITGKANGLPFTCEQGEVAFIDSYKKHNYKATCTTELFFINFDGLNCRAFYNEHLKATGVVAIIDEFDAHVNKIITLIEQASNNNFIKTSQISKLIYELLCDFIYDPDTSEKPHSILVQQMIDYISQNFDSKIKLNILCKKLYVSTQYAIKIFKKEVGKTPYQYLLEIKLKEAIRLLVETNLSIEDIADKVSFSSYYNFIKVFKEKYLATPAVYRKNIINKNSMNDKEKPYKIKSK